MSSSFITDRFWVVPQGAVLKLYGCISDNTSLDLMAAHMQRAEVLDCQELEAAGWHGLSNLMDYLAGEPNPPALRRVPSEIFEDLRMMRLVSSRIKVQSVYCPVVGSEGEERMRLVAMDLLRSLTQSNSPLALLPSGDRLLGLPTHFASPENGELRGSNLPTFANPWCAQRAEELTFWYDFLSFVHATVRLAKKMLISTCGKITQTIFQMRPEAMRAEVMINRIIAGSNIGFSGALQELSTTVQRCKTMVTVGLSKHDDALKKLMREFLEASMAANGQGEWLVPLLMKAQGSLAALDVQVAICEESGTSLGDKLLKFKYIKELARRVEERSGKGLGGEVLEQLIRDLKHPHLAKAKSWEAVKAVMGPVMHSLETNIERCIFVLQIFDLTRQMLEHRVAESKCLADGLPHFKDASQPWLAMRDTLVGIASKSVATDEERRSAHFYLQMHSPQGTVAPEPLVGAGETLLF